MVLSRSVNDATVLTTALPRSIEEATVLRVRSVPEEAWEVRLDDASERRLEDVSETRFDC